MDLKFEDLVGSFTFKENDDASTIYENNKNIIDTCIQNNGETCKESIVFFFFKMLFDMHNFKKRKNTTTPNENKKKHKKNTEKFEKPEKDSTPIKSKNEDKENSEENQNANKKSKENKDISIETIKENKDLSIDEQTNQEQVFYEVYDYSSEDEIEESNKKNEIPTFSKEEIEEFCKKTNDDQTVEEKSNEFMDFEISETDSSVFQMLEQNSDLENKKLLWIKMMKFKQKIQQDIESIKNLYKNEKFLKLITKDVNKKLEKKKEEDWTKNKEKNLIKAYTKMWYRDNKTNFMTITNEEISTKLIEYLKKEIGKGQKFSSSFKIQTLKTLIKESKKNIKYLYKPKDKCYKELCAKYPNYVINEKIQLETEVVKDMVNSKFSFEINDEEATKVAQWILKEKESFYFYTKPNNFTNLYQ
ncbi:hypothetical protein DICPUDRAFT_83167 [Dictyostelium purpureum]|uniref:Uncharacterized protein n=1 Tax=Dictyostelium purpureum TaxID=5786 RepID=F0ZYR2_DICPU|nr:uncharacterized protein DICPUDRAFT_83167 [Dictyostelium purpureum]EGC30929.1 hypothetical protein DICPUDRAFT_83167 [Dictyostelium purpureum]|eukprot:XP_003292558.1 hypothetical protein DICPUDRAFT_83167 [Dictyostelium purpureum]